MLLLAVDLLVGGQVPKGPCGSDKLPNSFYYTMLGEEGRKVCRYTSVTVRMIPFASYSTISVSCRGGS